MSKNICKSMNHKNDELYTPKILVDAIKPFYISFAEKFYADNGRYPNVWCPFDTENSEFVHLFKELPLKVGKLYYTHISQPDGKGDFFNLINYVDADVVISNPPFSKKLDVFDALNKRNIPWAMLCNTEALNYQEVGSYFSAYPISVIIPDKKVSFNGHTASFNTSYYCSPSFFGVNGSNGLIYASIKFVNLDNNNTGTNFVESRMYGDFEK